MDLFIFWVRKLMMEGEREVSIYLHTCWVCGAVMDGLR